MRREGKTTREGEREEETGEERGEMTRDMKERVESIAERRDKKGDE